MFSKNSRYRKLPDIVAQDAQGTSAVSKSLRLLPEVTGTFQHLIQESDRLDHLAYQYYREPRQWWRICDANPDFLAPQSILGQEPLATTYFQILSQDNNLPWCNLHAKLMQRIGIENVVIFDEIQLIEKDVVYKSQKVTIQGDHFERAVVVIYNTQNMGSEQIIQDIKGAGFNPGEVYDIGRVGKKIVIPPNSVT